MTGGWTSCEAQLEEEACGAGVKSRVILCVRTTGKFSYKGPYTLGDS